LARSSYTVSLRVEVLTGLGLSSSVTVDVIESPAPDIPFRSSVAFDASTSAQEISGDGVISLTHTSTGSNLGVFAVVVYDAQGSRGSVETTYGGTGMTEQWDAQIGANALDHAGYTLAGQATGAQTVTNDLVGAAANKHFLGVMSMTGVHQTTPVGTPATATGTVSPATVTVGSVGAEDLVVDNVGFQSAGAVTAGADQTEQNSEFHAGSSNGMKQSTQSGSAGGVMSWTLGGAPDFWGIGAIAFKPTSAASLTPLVGAGTLTGTGSIMGLGLPTKSTVRGQT